jgi:hypothetical protein
MKSRLKIIFSLLCLFQEFELHAKPSDFHRVLGLVRDSNSTLEDILNLGPEIVVDFAGFRKKVDLFLNELAESKVLSDSDKGEILVRVMAEWAEIKKDPDKFFIRRHKERASVWELLRDFFEVLYLEERSNVGFSFIDFDLALSNQQHQSALMAAFARFDRLTPNAGAFLVAYNERFSQDLFPLPRVEEKEFSIVIKLFNKIRHNNPDFFVDPLSLIDLDAVRSEMSNGVLFYDRERPLEHLVSANQAENFFASRTHSYGLYNPFYGSGPKSLSEKIKSAFVELFVTHYLEDGLRNLSGWESRPFYLLSFETLELIPEEHFGRFFETISKGLVSKTEKFRFLETLIRSYLFGKGSKNKDQIRRAIFALIPTVPSDEPFAVFKSAVKNVLTYEDLVNEFRGYSPAVGVQKLREVLREIIVLETGISFRNNPGFRAAEKRQRINFYLNLIESSDLHVPFLTKKTIFQIVDHEIVYRDRETGQYIEALSTARALIQGGRQGVFDSLIETRTGALEAANRTNCSPDLIATILNETPK